MFHIFNISILQLNFVTVLHALNYNNSSNTMQRLTRYLKDIEDIFTGQRYYRNGKHEGFFAFLFL